MDRWARESRFAVEAMRAAVTVLRAIGPASRKPIHKEDWTPVTAADFAVQAAMAGLFAREFPHDGVVAEEGSDPLRADARDALLASVAKAVGEIHAGVDESTVLAWLDRRGEDGSGRTWFLDPIDGTVGYLKGRPFAVAMAMIEGGQVEVGVLACPRYERFGADGCLALAVRGQGAWASGLREAKWERLRALPAEKGRRARLIRSVEAGWRARRRLARIRESLAMERAEIALDGQVKYLALAAGDGQLAVRLPRRQGQVVENVWDHAAGMLLAEEAGAAVSDVLGAPLDFGHGLRLDVNLGVVASTPELHDRALEAIGAVLTAEERGQPRLARLEGG